MKYIKINEENILDYYFSLESILAVNYKEINKDKNLIKYYSLFIKKICVIEKELCILIYSILFFKELISTNIFFYIFLNHANI